MRTRSLLVRSGGAGLLLFLLPAAALFAFSACGKKKPPASPEPPVAIVVADAGPDVPGDVAPASLYERLGGADAVKQVIEKLVENVSQDPAVNKSFKNTKGPKLEALKRNLADQLCEIAGGPCRYNGKDMKSAHKGMKIGEAQFDSFMNDLKLAMAEAKVPEPEQQELIEKLGPLREDVVEVKPKKK
jgi:hemoglobin